MAHKTVENSGEPLTMQRTTTVPLTHNQSLCLPSTTKSIENRFYSRSFCTATSTVQNGNPSDIDSGCQLAIPIYNGSFPASPQKSGSLRTVPVYHANGHPDYDVSNTASGFDSEADESASISSSEPRSDRDLKLVIQLF